jgi:hypothetical protein
MEMETYRNMKKILLLLLVKFLFVPVLYCQKIPGSEKEKIQSILSEFMHYIETKDSVRMYQLFHKGPVTWIGVYKDTSQKEWLKKDSSAVNYKIADYKTWFRNVCKPEPRKELFRNIEIVEDGSIASVTFDYSFWVNNKKGNWGKEFWHLINENGTWKIVSVIFSIELEVYKPEFSASVDRDAEAAALSRKMANEFLKMAALPGLSVAIRKND